MAQLLTFADRCSERYPASEEGGSCRGVWGNFSIGRKGFQAQSHQPQVMKWSLGAWRNREGQGAWPFQREAPEKQVHSFACQKAIDLASQ